MKPRSRYRGLSLFVTVGSTRFDKLVNKVLSDGIVDQLIELGFARMVIQSGKSEINKEELQALSQKIDIETYEYKPSIHDDIEAADLVVGHAGAGTCLEVLRLNRRLLLVVNDSLMDNHQDELAEDLAKDNFVVKSTVEELGQNLELICNTKLDKFPSKDTSKFEEIFDEALKKVGARL